MSRFPALEYEKTPDSYEAEVKELGQETPILLKRSKSLENKQKKLSHEKNELEQERIILWELNKYLEEKIQKEPSHKKNELERKRILLWEFNKCLVKNESISNEIFHSIGNDLRTPMVSIKAYSDMMIKGKFGKLTQEQQEKLERIKTNVDLLVDAIFKILEKSRKRDYKKLT